MSINNMVIEMLIVMKVHIMITTTIKKDNRYKTDAIISKKGVELEEQTILKKLIPINHYSI